MDILIIILILAISIGGGLLMGNILPEKERRKGEKHRIVRKLRSKAHHMELALDIAQDATTNEKRVLEHLNNFLLSVADDVEEL